MKGWKDGGSRELCSHTFGWWSDAGKPIQMPEKKQCPMTGLMNLPRLQ